MKKRKIEVAVVSDVHLGSYGARADELTTYLSSINPKKLILNGDIIDFGNSKNFFPATHTKVIRKIMSMASKGTEIYYIPGEHDAMMRKFDGTILGNLHICNHLEIDLDGKRVCFLHGNFFDLTMRYAKWLGRPLKYSNSVIKLFHNLFNRKFYRTDCATGMEKNTETIKFEGCFQSYCIDIGIKNNFDFVVVGHTHQPEKKLYEGSKGRCTYLNSGDWVENLTALEYNFKRWKIYRYSHDKLSAFFLDEDLKEIDFQELIANITSEKEQSEEGNKKHQSEKEGESSQE